MEEAQKIQKIKRKKKNNDYQNIKQKTNDRAARIPLRSGDEPDDPNEKVVTAPLVISIVLPLLNDKAII